MSLTHNAGVSPVHRERPIIFFSPDKKMEFVAHPLADDQLSALETLLASHYVVQYLPPDLLALVVLYLKAASRWLPDPQRP